MILEGVAEEVGGRSLIWLSEPSHWLRTFDWTTVDKQHVSRDLQSVGHLLSRREVYPS